MKTALCCVLFGCALALSALTTPAQSKVATGTPPFGSYTSGPDVINLANLNAHYTFPVYRKPGRGGDDFNYDLTYDTSIWYQSTVNGQNYWEPVYGYGWNGLILSTSAAVGGSLSNATTIGGGAPCNPPYDYTPVYYTNYVDWVYTDSHGTAHTFDGAYTSVVQGSCAYNYNTGMGPGSFTATADDGSGYLLVANGSSGTVYSSGGTMLGLAVNAPGGNITTTDRNGNQIASNNGVFTDSLGKTALTVTGGSSTGTTLTYTTSSGSTAQVQVAYAPYTIETNFGCSGVAEYGPQSNVYLVSSITLPDGSGYQFGYEENADGTTTGRLTSITLPTGGAITYAYTGGTNGIDCSDGSAAGLTRTMPDGSVWTFTRGYNPSTTTVTAPQLPYDNAPNQTVYTFNGLHETERQIYQGSGSAGTLLRTINTTWGQFGPATQVTVLEDALTQSEVDTNYDLYGNVLSSQEYDWGSGGRGPLIRTVTNTYASDTTFSDPNIVGLVSKRVVQDGSGSIVSRTDVSYDGRGNPTAVTTYTDPATPAGGVTQNTSYDQYGNAISGNLACCGTRQWNYSATTDYGYPDSVVTGSGPQVTTSSTYDLNTGLVLTSTDENGQTTSYTYDGLGRITSVKRPDSQVATTTYTDSGSNWSEESCAAVSAGTSACRETVFDNMGRPYMDQLLDGTGAVYSSSQKEFDALGRVYKTSDPYSGAGPQYWTETHYDAFGRPVETILADGGTTTESYSLNAVTVTDPTGKQKRYVYDALGRLTAVFEPDVTNGNALTQETSFAYDAQNNVTQVTEGAQTRTYVYDALGRLNSETTPEAGAVQYQYNSDNLVTQRTDARGVITTYTYDSLNRRTGVSYNVGSTGVPATPSVTWSYGTNSSQNNNGRLIGMTDGVGSESYAYDILGRLTQLQKVIGGQTYTMGYSYDDAGDLTNVVYPSGRVVQQNYDAIGRLCSVGASGSSCSSGTTYTSGLTYDAAGNLTNFTYGNGVAANFAYAPKSLQLQNVSYVKGTATLFSTNYWYKTDSTNCPSAPSANDGQIQCITDNVDNGRTVAYGYDALYRLNSAVTVGSSNFPKWGLSWTYDRYGNRVAQDVTAGTAPSNQMGFANPGGAQTNHPDGYSFDAGGSMTYDGENTLTYDAANRVVGSSGSLGAGTYAYDGNDLRVEKTSGGVTTIYIYSGGKVIAEYDGNSSSPSLEYIYSASRLVAALPSGNYDGSPGEGSASVGGGEQTADGPPAVAGSGSVTFSGALQSKQVQTKAAVPGTGSATFTSSGYPGEISQQVNECPNTYPYNCWQTVYYYNNDTITMTAGGQSFTTSGGAPSSVASGMASQINAHSSLVTASASGNTVNITAKTAGAGTNYSLSCCTYTYNSQHFSGPEDWGSASGSSLAGGADAVYTTVYDSGTSTITVNGHSNSVGWSGSGSTPSSIASALASNINGDSGASVSASASGSTVSLTAKTTGVDTNYSLSSSSTYDSSNFSSPSFSSGNSGSTLTGGQNATGTIWDTGNVWITVNGFQASVNYGQSDTPATIATNLANIFNTNGSSPVTATVSSNSLTLTAKTAGSGTNYPLSGGSSTSQPGTFSQPSFSVSTSGTTLGWTSTMYYQPDNLSIRVITDSNGNMIGQEGEYPFGESWYEPDATTKWKFTTYERDPESGNDYAMARTYVSRLGRFSSPDEHGGDITNPQSLNRYVYALNDPIGKVDPSGMDCMNEDGVDLFACAAGEGGEFMASFGGTPASFAPMYAYLNGQGGGSGLGAKCQAVGDLGCSNKNTSLYQPGNGINEGYAQYENYIYGQVYAKRYQPNQLPPGWNAFAKAKKDQSGNIVEYEVDFRNYLEAAAGIPQSTFNFVAPTLAANPLPNWVQQCTQAEKALQQWMKTHPGQEPPDSLVEATKICTNH